ncbi:hypothetical protein M0811_01141 [Anaeramoeba ignava]|uniref:BTB/POZ domain-containing protein n=1 Tax=Anaeramoeba ignava TaxID=1746090 RepID=A0A9Q0LNS3_ANAIG|nr:hypothetical protein M0811_01141 [Anaeramoeba ignava]
MNSLSQEIQQKLIQDYFKINGENLFTDFSIETDEKKPPLRCHRIILFARSQFFKDLFQKSKTEDKITIQDIPRKVLQQTLSYLYSGICDIDETKFVDFLKVAEKFQLDELKKHLEVVIKDKISVGNVLSIFNALASLNLSYPEIQKESEKIIKQNIKAILKTEEFLSLSEETLEKILSIKQIQHKALVHIFQGLLKWGKHRYGVSSIEEMDQKKVEEFQNLIQNLMLKIQLQNITIRQIEEMKKLKFFDEIPQQIQFNINLLAKKNKQDQEIEKLQQETEKVKKKIIKTVNQENQEKPKKPKKPKTKDEPKKEDLGPFVGSSIITKKIYAQYLKAWLKDDSFFNHLQICFSAAKDGFDCKIFHQKCDDRKKTLVLIKTTENFIFGGYTSVGWQKGSNKKKDLGCRCLYLFLEKPQKSQTH